MYIGEFSLPNPSECWTKNTTFPVKLYKPVPDNSLVAVTGSNGVQKVVLAMNAVGTFGYKSAALRYASVVEINEQFWVVSAEC
jgi:hypothetical protein